jgi:hypothetical protein
MRTMFARKPITLALGLTFCCLATLPVSSLAANPQASAGAADQQVCRWLTRNDRLSMHCGPRSEILALQNTSTPTAARSAPSQRRQITFTNKPAVVSTPAADSSTQTPANIQLATTAAPVKAYMLASMTNNTTTLLVSTEAPSAVNMAAEMAFAAAGRTTSMPTEYYMAEASRGESAGTTAPKAESYMVTAVGTTEDILAQLRDLQDPDYLWLRRQPYANRVSLGVYNQVSAARRRQAQLAAHGIHSELIDRNRKASNQSLVAGRD